MLRTTPTNLLILAIVWFCFSFILTSFKLGGALFIITTLIMGIVNKILIHLRATPLLAYFFLQIFDGLKIAENTAFTLASNIPPLVSLSLRLHQRSLFASILQNHLQNRSNDSKNQWEVAKVSPIQPSSGHQNPDCCFRTSSLHSILLDPWFIRLQIR